MRGLSGLGARNSLISLRYAAETCRGEEDTKGLLLRGLADRAVRLLRGLADRSVRLLRVRLGLPRLVRPRKESPNNPELRDCLSA